MSLQHPPFDRKTSGLTPLTWDEMPGLKNLWCPGHAGCCWKALFLRQRYLPAAAARGCWGQGRGWHPGPRLGLLLVTTLGRHEGWWDDMGVFACLNCDRIASWRYTTLQKINLHLTHDPIVLTLRETNSSPLQDGWKTILSLWGVRTGGVTGLDGIWRFLPPRPSSRNGTWISPLPGKPRELWWAGLGSYRSLQFSSLYLCLMWNSGVSVSTFMFFLLNLYTYTFFFSCNVWLDRMEVLSFQQLGGCRSHQEQACCFVFSQLGVKKHVVDFCHLAWNPCTNLDHSAQPWFRVKTNTVDVFWSDLNSFACWSSKLCFSCFHMIWYMYVLVLLYIHW